jgi:GNAT superfamily N-acetyltransferase
LNDYFTNDCIVALGLLTAVTYVMESEGKTVAFVSLLNDKITLSSLSPENQVEVVEATGKNFHGFPAVKIGRLGVHSDYKKLGIGTQIIDFIKTHFVSTNKTGCRYLTVDAYVSSIGFYEKNDFRPMNNKDAVNTKSMFLDLYPVFNTMRAIDPNHF